MNLKIAGKNSGEARVISDRSEFCQELMDYDSSQKPGESALPLNLVIAIVAGDSGAKWQVWPTQTTWSREVVVEKWYLQYLRFHVHR